MMGDTVVIVDTPKENLNRHIWFSGCTFEEWFKGRAGIGLHDATAKVTVTGKDEAIFTFT
jgi:hypothetical protein